MGSCVLCTPETRKCEDIQHLPLQQCRQYLRLVIHMVKAATAMPVPRTEVTTMAATLPGARFWLSRWIVMACDLTVPVSPAALTALTAM